MKLWEIIAIAVGLSMDAFAVSICKGLTMPKMKYSRALIVGLFFGGAQALMPLIGWLLGRSFESYITSVDHWIAFALLAFLGGKMIFEALKKDDEEEKCACAEKLDFKELTVMAIATSIDALAIGITFAFLKVDISVAVSLIGVITFVICFIGVIIGHLFGAKFKSKAEIFGGAVLVLLGIKILLEHLGVIGF